MLALIDRAGKNRPDIICLTETPFNNDTGLSPEEIAQPIPGSLTEEISQRAAEHKTYITFSMIERDGDFFYNTAVLIDKTGNLLGTYRKTHLPLVETEKGIVPGDDYPVFNTEFGCIGIMICWDHWFPETARILRLKGAEIIFVLSQRNPLQDKSNLIQSQARAVDNGVYLVVAGVYGRNASTIIDPEGTVIGKVASLGKDYCITEIDLNKKHLTPYLSVGSIGEGKSIYIKERRTDTYGILSEQ
jgi:predicted amidohydrolase